MSQTFGASSIHVFFAGATLWIYQWGTLPSDCRYQNMMMSGHSVQISAPCGLFSMYLFDMCRKTSAGISRDISQVLVNITDLLRFVLRSSPRQFVPTFHPLPPLTSHKSNLNMYQEVQSTYLFVHCHGSGSLPHHCRLLEPFFYCFSNARRVPISITTPHRSFVSSQATKIEHRN